MREDMTKKLYNLVYEERLSYDEVIKKVKGGSGKYFTRPEWIGFHYIEDGVYKIMTKSWIILEDPKEIFDKDKDDWCVVEITMEALKLMLK